MKFRFTPLANLLDSSGHLVKRPMLILETRTKEGRIIEVPALVDSGADKTQVNYEYAEILGAKLGDECNSIGIGDAKVPGYSGSFSFGIKNTTIKMEVPVTYLKTRNVDVLLGRDVFFDMFKIVFEQGKNTFELVQVK
ncbi:MAG: hypothetical protein AAB759_00150 [Patescibacteria group bacterium]